MIGGLAVRELGDDHHVLIDEWYHGTTLERLAWYGANEFTPHPGMFLASNVRAAWRYATSNPQETPVLVTVRLAEWLLAVPYRADIDPADMNDRGNVIAMRYTLGDPNATDDAVIVTDPHCGIPDTLALVILSEEAAAAITVTAHETCDPEMIPELTAWEHCLGHLSIDDILNQIRDDDD